MRTGEETRALYTLLIVSPVLGGVGHANFTIFHLVGVINSQWTIKGSVRALLHGFRFTYFFLGEKNGPGCDFD